MADLQIAQIRLGFLAYRSSPGLILRSAQSKKRSLRRSSRFALPAVCRWGGDHMLSKVLSKFTRQSEKPSAMSKYCRCVRYRCSAGARSVELLAAEERGECSHSYIRIVSASPSVELEAALGSKNQNTMVSEICNRRRGLFAP